MEKKGKLELTWVGKYEEEKLEPRILIEDKSKSYGESNTENMLIHGDNLLALKALENKYTGMIKCIYIDPPYNTGAAFEHYDDNLEHSIWLGIMKKRLEILRNLLAEDGTIWIQIDDEEQAYLKVLCDEIFGRNNFVNMISVNMKNVAGVSGGGEDKKIKKNCEYVLVYARNYDLMPLFTETYKFKDLFEFGKVKGVQGKIYTSQTPLNKDVQGIVLFSRGKLVQEHSSFDDRANDNFFQYMSGSFDVDFIDNSFDVDNCSTDRKSLAWDIDENEELFKLQELIKKLVSIAQKKWREQRKAEKKRKVSSHGYDVDEWIKALNPAERPLAQKLTNAIIENDDIAEDIAADYIGCIKDMYSFEGFKQFTAELDELQELDNEHAIKLLTDWNTIEAKEYAKIAIGRVKTIEQFEKFIQTNASERDVIQKFLEEFPWLLDAKMSKFEREITYTKLLKQKFNDESILPESNRRLDFLCTNSAGVIHVIELKRPRIKLTMKEIQQICEYVEFIETQFPQTQGNVKGFLISDNMTYEPGANKYRKGLEKEGIFIKSYSDLLAEARRYNDDLYKMYEDISMKKNNKSDK